VSVIADSSTTTRSHARSRQSSSSAAPGEPLASRSWVATEPAILRAVRPSGEDVGGDLAGGQPEHPSGGRPAQLPVGLGARERADDERFAGAGRSDEGLDPGAGGEDPLDGGGLIDAEFDALAAQPVEE
jgi:hypothetical protein